MVKEHCTFYNNEKYSQDQVDKKVKWTGKQLKKMNADIVGFEEVFHDEVLSRAVTKSGVYEGAELICPNADGTSPRVALLSRFPIKEKNSIVDFPKESELAVDGRVIPIRTFSRPILRSVITLPSGHDVTVFVTHMKSKRPIVDDKKRHDQKAKAVGHALSTIVRAAEAAAFRCLLVDEMRNTSRPVIVIGDLNDVVHSSTTEIVTGTPPWKMLSREQKEKIWDVLLWSTNEVQVRASDRDVTYSHIHNGRYEVLDHILVSQELVRSNPNHIGYVQFLQHFNDHLVDETLSDQKRDLTVSDHGQVVVSIKLFAKDSSRPPKPSPHEIEGEGEQREGGDKGKQVWRKK
jgi:endonuclease/exonuclease/phosphatase family metal-dependent hydrolase